MIGILVLALQSAAPDVVVDTVTTTTNGFQTTHETQPMILYYADCLAPPGVIVRPPTSGTAEARAKARIVACADVRKWAASTGAAAYKPEHDGDPDGAHYVNRSLDQVEQGFLSQARFEDKLMSGEIKPTDLTAHSLKLGPDGKPNDHQ